MPIGAIAGTTKTPAPTPAASATSNTTLDRQAFLKLLVAQLKYQDPSKPMDASEMISQSAQLSVVDKLGEISTALTSSGITDRLMLAGSVIGKQITFAGEDGAPTSATVTSARFVNGSMVLSAGEWDVPISAVNAIGPAPAPSAPAPTAPASPAASPTPAAAAFGPTGSPRVAPAPIAPRTTDPTGTADPTVPTDPAPVAAIPTDPAPVVAIPTDLTIPTESPTQETQP